MATIFIPIPISDSSVTDGTNPAKTGLTPTVLGGINIVTNAAISSGNYPTITVGPTSGASGFYTASYDPEANGEAQFQIDAGSGLSKNVDRFFYLVFTKDSGRIASGFSSTGALATASIDLPTLTPTLAALLLRGYLVSTGTTTGPVTADLYHVAGVNSNVPYYQSSTLGTPVYVWTDGTFWYMTTTAPGITLPAGYFKTASAATAVGPYTAQGTASGTPAIAAHGNAILAAYQPEGPLSVNVTQFAGHAAVVDANNLPSVNAAAWNAVAISTTVPPTAAQIDTQLTGTHGSGVWGSGDVILGSGTVASASSTTVFTATGSGLPQNVNTALPMSILFQTGTAANKYDRFRVASYSNPSGTATITLLDAAPTSPVSGDTFVIG